MYDLLLSENPIKSQASAITVGKLEELFSEVFKALVSNPSD